MGVRKTIITGVTSCAVLEEACTFSAVEVATICGISALLSQHCLHRFSIRQNVSGLSAVWDYGLDYTV